MKANIGSSTAKDARTAGVEAAKKAAEGIGKPKLALLFSSVNYDLKELLAGAAEALPETEIVGNTSFTGVVTPEDFITSEDGFVGILALDDSELRTGISGMAKTGIARETGQQVARQAMIKAGCSAPPDYFFMTASSGEEEDYLKGITDVIGRVPMFGGTAADNSIAGEWKIYCGENIFPEGVAVAFFYTDKPMKNLFTGAYRETDDVGLITKIEGKRTLMEIDGIPAVEKYASWTNVEPESLAGGALLAATITSPLGVKDRLGDLIAIRHPMNGNPDNSMAIGSNLAEKTAVIRMEASVDELIQAAKDTFTQLRDSLPEPPAAYLLVHCGGRRAGIDSRINEVSEALKVEAQGVPFIMEFTFGEYGYVDDGMNTVGGLMLSYTAFGK